MPDSQTVMTEQSMEADGLVMPTIVPGTLPVEINYMRETGHPSRGQEDVAYRFGLRRLKSGLSPYAKE